MGTALDDLLVLLDLEPLEVNLFRGVSPDEDRQRVFGGQVAAQALVAAGRTVERRPARCTRCTRTSCGRATRTSRSSTTSTASATAGASRPAASSRSSTGGRSSTCRRRSRSSRPGPTTSDPMPDVPRPDDAARRSSERIEPYLERSRRGLRRVARAGAADRLAARRATRAGSTRRRASPSRTCGSGRTATLPDDPLLHACVVAYASDLTLLDTAMLPHAISYDDGRVS